VRELNSGGSLVYAQDSGSGGASMPIFTRRSLPPSRVISIGLLAKRSFRVRVPSTPSASVI